MQTSCLVLWWMCVLDTLAPAVWGWMPTGVSKKHNNDMFFLASNFCASCSCENHNPAFFVTMRSPAAANS